MDRNPFTRTKKDPEAGHDGNKDPDAVASEDETAGAGVEDETAGAEASAPGTSGAGGDDDNRPARKRRARMTRARIDALTDQKTAALSASVDFLVQAADRLLKHDEEAPVPKDVTLKANAVAAHYAGIVDLRRRREGAVREENTGKLMTTLKSIATQSEFLPEDAQKIIDLQESGAPQIDILAAMMEAARNADAARGGKAGPADG